MTYEQAEKSSFNPFDLTKVCPPLILINYYYYYYYYYYLIFIIIFVQIWPHKEYPLMPVGKITLNRNPSNYFFDVEQSAFSPAHMPPGIEASPDKMLQV